MKQFLFAVMAVFCTITMLAQSRADYDKTVQRFMIFYNHNQPDSIFNMLSATTQTQLPYDKLNTIVMQLQAQLGEMKTGEFIKNNGALYYYKATFANAILTFLISLDKDNKLETMRFLPYTEEKTGNSNFILKTNDGNVYGTLTIPDSKIKVPAVLIIAGSGPTDRDCNSPSLGLKTNAYQMLADSLLKEGIACVRYDKRCVGESNGITKATFNDMVNDAAGFVKMLKNDNRFSNIYIAGHSEGSLIGIMAAQKDPVAGLISIAGVGEKADKIIEEQLSAQSKDVSAKATIILDSLKQGYIVKNVDPGLAMLFNASTQPYIITWLKYNPALEIKKLKEPVLILQGSHDIQVSVQQAEILKKADPAATLKIIDGMNHILKSAPAERQANAATYSNPDLPLNAEFAHTIIQFVKTGKSAS